MNTIREKSQITNKNTLHNHNRRQWLPFVLRMKFQTFGDFKPSKTCYPFGQVYYNFITSYYHPSCQVCYKTIRLLYMSSQISFVIYKSIFLI